MFNNGPKPTSKLTESFKDSDKYLASESSSDSTSTVDETTIWGLLQTTTNNSLAVWYHSALALISFAITLSGLSSVCLALAHTNLFVWFEILLTLSVVSHWWFLQPSFSGYSKLHHPYWPTKSQSMTSGWCYCPSLNAAAYRRKSFVVGFKLSPVGQQPAAVLVSLMEKPCVRLSCHATKLMLPNLSTKSLLLLKDTTIAAIVVWLNSSKLQDYHCP